MDRPRTNAEKDMVRAARAMVQEWLTQGRTADEAWERATAVLDSALVLESLIDSDPHGPDADRRRAELEAIDLETPTSRILAGVAELVKAVTP